MQVCVQGISIYDPYSINFQKRTKKIILPVDCSSTSNSVIVEMVKIVEKELPDLSRFPVCIIISFVTQSTSSVPSSPDANDDEVYSNVSESADLFGNDLEK